MHAYSYAYAYYKAELMERAYLDLAQSLAAVKQLYRLYESVTIYTVVIYHFPK